MLWISCFPIKPEIILTKGISPWKIGINIPEKTVANCQDIHRHNVQVFCIPENRVRNSFSRLSLEKIQQLIKVVIRDKKGIRKMDAGHKIFRFPDVSKS